MSDEVVDISETRQILFLFSDGAAGCVERDRRTRKRDYECELTTFNLSFGASPFYWEHSLGFDDRGWVSFHRWRNLGEGFCCKGWVLDAVLR